MLLNEKEDYGAPSSQTADQNVHVVRQLGSQVTQHFTSMLCMHINMHAQYRLQAFCRSLCWLASKRMRVFTGTSTSYRYQQCSIRIFRRRHGVQCLQLPSSKRLAWCLGMQICKTSVELLQAGVIDPDCKPENFMVHFQLLRGQQRCSTTKIDFGACAFTDAGKNHTCICFSQR